MVDNRKQVLLTGAGGFVASHILRELVEQRHEVIATVRSEQKAEEIRALHPEWQPSVTFEYVKDIVEENAFTNIFNKYHNKIDYIIHTASPVTFTIKNIQSELIDPAVKGVQNILKDAHNKGGPSIKRFVLLASAVAVLNSFDDISTPGKSYTENDWNPVTAQAAIEAKSAVLGYNASKKLAEEAAWEFIKSDTTLSFDLTTINPDIITGPPLQPISGPHAVNETNMFAVYDFLNGKYQKVEDARFPFYHFVDVRDVASASVAALEIPGAGGKRILLVADKISPQLVVNIIRQKFPHLVGRLPPGGKSDQIFPAGVNPTGWDVSKSSAILSERDGFKGKKWTYRNLETSVVDTISKLLELEENWSKQET